MPPAGVDLLKARGVKDPGPKGPGELSFFFLVAPPPFGGDAREKTGATLPGPIEKTILVVLFLEINKPNSVIKLMYLYSINYIY